MKRLNLLLVIFTLFYGLATGQVNFVKINNEAALQKAKQEDKMVFLYFTADWCAPCQWMEKHTFQDELVIYWLNDQFISVKADVETELGRHLNGIFEIKKVPALIFLNQNGKVLKKIHSSVTAEDLRTLLKSLELEMLEQKQFQALKVPAYQLKKEQLLSRPALIPDDYEQNYVAIPITNRQRDYNELSIEREAYVAPRQAQSYQLALGTYPTYEKAIDQVLKVEKMIDKKVEISTQKQGKDLSYMLQINQIESKQKAEETQQRLQRLGLEAKILIQ